MRRCKSNSRHSKTKENLAGTNDSSLEASAVTQQIDDRSAVVNKHSHPNPPLTEGDQEAGHAHTVERGNTPKRNAQLDMQSAFDVNAPVTTVNAATPRWYQY